MNDYAPASSLGWLDFDGAASEQVSTLLRSLDEPGTLDVLGLGSIRDALADMLAPGTSTLQTRLRYFIFLPWIFQRLEAEKIPPTDFARKLRDYEAKLIDRLHHLGPNQGVIGYHAKRDLKRMPSDIYWSGLGAWGIRHWEVSLAEYPQRAAALNRSRPERDDDGNTTVRTAPMWAQVPSPPTDFLDMDAKLGFKLQPDEAHFLLEHIRRRHPHTLLAVLSAAPRMPDNVLYPWDLPTGGMPEELIEILHHARCFSELTLGPQLVYNLLLARKAKAELSRDADELEARQRELLRAWARRIGGRHDELLSWADDLADFWIVLADQRVGAATRSFVTGIVQRAVNNPESFAEESGVHELIRQREFRLKSQRARLVNRSALENWNGQPVGGQFDYRWTTTKRYLSDIAEAVSANADADKVERVQRGYPSDATEAVGVA